MITIDPRVQFGHPCVDGTRLEPDFLAGLWWHRAVRDVDELCDDYDVTRAQVVLACWYVARYGTTTWRRRWGGWLAEVADRLWHGDYNVPLPPQKGKV